MNFGTISKVLKGEIDKEIAVDLSLYRDINLTYNFNQKTKAVATRPHNRFVNSYLSLMYNFFCFKSIACVTCPTVTNKTNLF